jgi:hypothetical protein
VLQREPEGIAKMANQPGHRRHRQE